LSLTENELLEKISLQRISETPQIIPLFPGEPPNTEDLIQLRYFMYNPEEVTDSKNVVYDFVGTDIKDKFTPAYDEEC
jgi:hypothetical protein